MKLFTGTFVRVIIGSLLTLTGSFGHLLKSHQGITDVASSALTEPNVQVSQTSGNGLTQQLLTAKIVTTLTLLASLQPKQLGVVPSPLITDLLTKLSCQPSLMTALPNNLLLNFITSVAHKDANLLGSLPVTVLGPIVQSINAKLRPSPSFTNKLNPPMCWPSTPINLPGLPCLPTKPAVPKPSPVPVPCNPTVVNPPILPPSPPAVPIIPQTPPVVPVPPQLPPDIPVPPQLPPAVPIPPLSPPAVPVPPQSPTPPDVLPPTPSIPELPPGSPSTPNVPILPPLPPIVPEVTPSPYVTTDAIPSSPSPTLPADTTTTAATVPREPTNTPITFSTEIIPDGYRIGNKPKKLIESIIKKKFEVIDQVKQLLYDLSKTSGEIPSVVGDKTKKPIVNVGQKGNGSNIYILLPVPSIHKKIPTPPSIFPVDPDLIKNKIYEIAQHIKKPIPVLPTLDIPKKQLPTIQCNVPCP